MTRALVLVLDSVGVGGAADAAAYGDEGADTIGHIAEACASHAADRAGVRSGPLHVPNLCRLGLGEACRLATGRVPAGLSASPSPQALYGCAAEVSKGKDTPSGHWELAGVPVSFAWGTFPRTVPCFPSELTDAICRLAGTSGILGNTHASGTAILDSLGEQHMRTGWPIVYTSADSVIQIAAHEETFGLKRLQALCAALRPVADRYRVGRVIARPFVGAKSGAFTRTGHRRDYSIIPPSPTVLDKATDAGRDVVTVGKIADIFAHSGTGRVMPAHGNAALFDATLAATSALAEGGLLFANFIDFDSLYGHRRDVAGYAAALESFDAALPRFEALLRPGDLAIITADHGCDPTWNGTDHTREKAPVLAFGPGIAPRSIGRRESFADVGASVARHLGLDWSGAGSPFVS